MATIDSTGTLRGLIPGTTTITVSAAGLAAERVVTVVPVPASMTLTAGGEQRSAAGQRVPDPVSVQVVSRSGRPVPDVIVRFEAAGTGRADPDTVTTDARGVATTRWTLGPVPGRQRLAVEVTGIDSAMVVTAEADPTAKNTRIVLLTDSLAGEAGTLLARPVALQVTDTSGLALADVPVSWTALDGGAFSQADARTDSLGEAHAHWRLGPKAGRQRARVQVGNPRTLPPFAIAARASAGEAASLVGDRAATRSGAWSARRWAMRWSSARRTASAIRSTACRSACAPRPAPIDSLVQTGADGRISVRWTLGNAAGPVRLVARLEAQDDSAVVTATALPGQPKTLYFASAPASGTAGRALPKPVQVIVRDRFGNPIPKVDGQLHHDDRQGDAGAGGDRRLRPRGDHLDARARSAASSRSPRR